MEFSLGKGADHVMSFGKYYRPLLTTVLSIVPFSSLAIPLQAQGNLGHSTYTMSSGTLLAQTSTTLSAQAGPDKSVTLPYTFVTVSGVVQGGTAQWAQVSGPKKALIKNSASATTVFKFDRAGTYVMRLTALSSGGAKKTDEVTITVNPNPVVISGTSTPLDHLKVKILPVYKQGSTLLPLTHSSCGLSENISVELAKNWGFALQVGAADARYLDYGPNYGFDQNNFVKLIKANPGKYSLAVGLGSMYSYFDNYDGRHPDLPKLPATTWLRDSSGKIILSDGRPTVSPAAPNETFEIIGNFIGQSLGPLEKLAGQPIKIFLNGGEYGLWLIGDGGPAYLQKDPTVVADFNKSGLTDWYAYVSRNKARQEGVLKETMYKYLNTRPAYSWYQEQYGTERGRWFNWKGWMFLYEYFLNSSGKPIVSDYPAPEMYYNFHNSGWSGVHWGSMVPWDALTQALNNISGTISLGQPLVYPWISGGWEGWDGQPITDIHRYFGMLKMYYTAGAIGSTTGYFVCSGPLWEALKINKQVGTTTPILINHLAVAGRIHALFSHLEEYLRNGDLLPGPNQHPYSGKDGTKALPAMEFPVEGETAQQPGAFGPITIPTARVLARKIRGEDRWLVTAWANVGEDRDIKVTIDYKLGPLTLRARKAGSVYVVTIVNGKPKVTLIDTYATNPTASFFP